MSMDRFDLVVVGGGSAGYAAARTGHELGLKVAVIDGAKELGGLCILRGCMPSKTLIATANRARAVREAGQLAIEAKFLGVDPKALHARKVELIQDFASYRRRQLEDGRFALVRGRAGLLGEGRLRVELRNGGQREIEAGAIVLAAGSVLSLPDVPGLREAEPWSSDDVLDADEIPASVIVLGGGAIACELACFYEGVGSRVIQIQRSDRILTDADEDTADSLAGAMRSRGIELCTGTDLQEVRRLADGSVEVDFLDRADGERRTVAAAQLVAALGRKPASESLGLEVAGLMLEKGRPRVNASQRCHGPGLVYAAGDLVGPWELVHLAVTQGEIAARNAARALGALGGEPETMEDHAVFFGVFTEPEFAQVGLTERQCAERGLEVAVASHPFDDHGKSLVTGETDGFVKIIATKADKQIVGAAMVGPHATDLLHSMALAVYLRLEPAQLVAAPWYHPTLHEIWSYPIEELAEELG